VYSTISLVVKDVAHSNEIKARRFQRTSGTGDNRGEKKMTTLINEVNGRNTVDRTQFIERWNEVVNDLNGLKWNLTSGQSADLTVLQDKIKKVILGAADNREVKR
jgi:hypothetical protein